ncbi:MAG: hypothetical protein J6X53_03945 [Abditibacteriota bacterium]|nr:hypothetical protein [Abditibacteriota bacterium]
MTTEEVNTMKLYGTLQRCFDGLTQYGARCAADGWDTSQLRRIAMEFAETCGIDYDYIKEAFVLDDLGRRFDDAVSQAARSGTAPEMTEKMKADTLAGLNICMDEMSSNENMEHWIEECRTLSRTMQDEWSRAKPAPEKGAERSEEMPDTAPEGSRIRPLSPAKMRDFGHLLALPHTDAERDWLRERLELLSVMESIAFSAALSRTQPESAKDAVNVLLDSHYYELFCPAPNYEALGKFYAEEKGLRIPADAREYTDFTSFGRRFENERPGLFVGDCYVAFPAKPMRERYNGENLDTLDNGWTIRIKLASPGKPEGCWMHLPDPHEMDEAIPPGEVFFALRELGVKTAEECTILDAWCNVPGVGDIAAQYDRAEVLLEDANNLGIVLNERGYWLPDFERLYAAALSLDCQSLSDALEISQNLDCYETIEAMYAAEIARQKLDQSRVPEEARKAINMDGYGKQLLANQGYHLAGDVYVRRTGEFQMWQRPLHASARSREPEPAASADVPPPSETTPKAGADKGKRRKHRRRGQAR